MSFYTIAEPYLLADRATAGDGEMSKTISFALLVSISLCVGPFIVWWVRNADFAVSPPIAFWMLRQDPPLLAYGLGLLFSVIIAFGVAGSWLECESD